MNLLLKGLKTGMYYLRTKPAVNAIQFTVDKQKIRNKSEVSAEFDLNLSTNSEKEAQLQRDMMLCSLSNKDSCIMCSG